MGQKIWWLRRRSQHKFALSPDGGYFLIGHSASIAGYDKSQAKFSDIGWLSDLGSQLDEHGNKANTLLYDHDEMFSHGTSRARRMPVILRLIPDRKNFLFRGELSRTRRMPTKRTIMRQSFVLRTPADSTRNRQSECRRYPF